MIDPIIKSRRLKLGLALSCLFLLLDENIMQNTKGKKTEPAKLREKYCQKIVDARGSAGQPPT